METERVLAKKTGYVFFSFVGVLLVFFCKTGMDLAEDGNILWTGDYVLPLLALSLGLGILLGCGICFLLCRLAESRFITVKSITGKLIMDKLHMRPMRNRAAQIADGNCSGKWKWWAECPADRKGRVFLVSFLLVLISFLPVYLAFYPGICAYDITIQMEQLELGMLNEHHPLLHTLLIKGMLTVGTRVFGSVNVGIALYVALQMMTLALAFAYALTLLYFSGAKWYWKLSGLLYCLFFPFHHYMAVSTTKDTIFSAFFLVCLLSLAVLLKEKRNNLKVGKTDMVLLFSGVGAVLFRNNGKYAMLVLVCFLLLAIWRGKDGRRMYVRLFGVVAVALVVGQLILTAVFHVSGAGQGDKREMLSMPIQQLARCMVYHGGAGVMPEDDNTISDEDKALINDFLLNESYKYYQPSLSDPVKTHTNTYVVRYRTGEFVGTYLRLLGEYPGDFVNAALALDAGYLYPGDVSHAYVYAREGAVGEGYVQVIWAEERLNGWGVHKDSKWQWLHDVMETWADENAYLDIPVLKYFFVPGSYLWLYLIWAGWLLLTRRYKMLLPLGLVLGYYITLLLGPTVQLRYLYPLMIALPFLVLLADCGGGKREGREQNETLCG